MDKEIRIEHFELHPHTKIQINRVTIVAGLPNSEIAESMCLGYATIKTYPKNLILKLDAHNTAHLMRIAIEQKLV